MAFKKYIDSSISTKILANNLVDILLNKKPEDVCKVFEGLDDIKVLLCPLEKNGYISYEKYSGSMYDAVSTTAKEEHYLNILELICEIPKFNQYLLFILDNDKLKKDLINNNEFKNNYHTHFTIEEVVQFSLKNDLPEDNRFTLYHTLKEFFSTQEILSLGKIDPKNKKNLEKSINPELLEDISNGLKKSSKSKLN